MPDQNKTIIVSGDDGFPELRQVDFTQGRKRDLHEEDLPDLVTPDATSGPAEWGRYHDAVREAARSFDSPQEGDIHHFLNARARNPKRVDAKAFHEAVKRQRMADLVDIVDHHMRRDGSLPRGSRMVRTQAPKGYMRRVLRNATAEELAHLHHRLTAIGHHHEGVSKYISSRVAPDMWDQASVYEVKMSEGEFEGLLFDDGEYQAEWETMIEDAIDAIRDIKPEIHVHINNGDLNGPPSS